MCLPGRNGQAWYIGNNTTMVPCGQCPEDSAFCVPFHGVRARGDGQLVPLSCNRLPDVPRSMTDAEAQANEESLAAMDRHYCLVHPRARYKVSQQGRINIFRALHNTACGQQPRRTRHCDYYQLCFCLLARSPSFASILRSSQGTTGYTGTDERLTH